MRYCGAFLRSTVHGLYGEVANLRKEYEELDLKIIYFEKDVFLAESGQWDTDSDEMVGNDGDIDWGGEW